MAQNQLGNSGVGTGNGGSNVLSIVSFPLSAIAILFFPIIFGVVAIILAAVGLARKERLAKIALVVAIAATVTGMLLGAMAVSAVS
ncbi:hypothetical protein [Georgenia faecalis]|uniref:DUF4190 domain-containing protein n=1 Tax=Georgenia faecalis TaxID=2483799 RepID=A0ABV9D5J5_9MICO|nr:hypothetical protein [Georgenia faecalis]